jgi:hypothetical protein
MFRPFVSAVLATAVLAAPAFAEQVVIARPIEAASLHEGPLDMVAYYVPTEGGALEVTATFAPHEPRHGQEPASPMRVVLALGESDVSFAMPGYPRALYRFLRVGEAVAVSVRQANPLIVDARGRLALTSR